MSRQKARARSNGAVAGLIALIIAGGGVAAAGLSGAIDRQTITLALDGRMASALVLLGFGIDQVGLTGNRYTSDRDIFDTLDLGNVRTFAAFDADAALKRLSRLPWIESAQISRIFPGQLDIRVRERRPAVVWRRGDKSYLLDAGGRVLGSLVDPSRWPLPIVAGEGAPPEQQTLLTALRRHPELTAQVDFSERIAERRWSIVFKNGSRLELAADREDEGLTAFANRLELKRTMTGAPFIVDVRTPGRIALRPATRGAAANAAAAREHGGALGLQTAATERRP